MAENCSVTPLIFSTAGGVSQLTKWFLQMLSTRLSEKKLGSYAQALCWLRTRLAFTIARAGSLCLRGCRVKFRNKTDVDSVSALSAARLMYIVQYHRVFDLSPHVLFSKCYGLRFI